MIEFLTKSCQIVRLHFFDDMMHGTAVTICHRKVVQAGNERNEEQHIMVVLVLSLVPAPIDRNRDGKEHEKNARGPQCYGGYGVEVRSLKELARILEGINKPVELFV